MAVQFADRCCMSVSSGGTGDLTLSATRVGSYLLFDEGGVTSGSTITYTIIDGASFEVGEAAYNTSTRVLSRAAGVVTKSFDGATVGTTKINVNAGAIVIVTAKAADLQSAARLSIADGTTLTQSASTTLTGGTMREVLGANRSLYVNNSTGSDTLYDGKSATVSGSTGPFATIQKAFDVAGALDPAIYNVTIFIQGTGTNYAGAGLKAMLGTSRIFITGVPGGTTQTNNVTAASPAVVSWTGGLPEEGTPIAFTSVGTLTGITAGTTYYVKSPSGGSFNISASVGGAAINTGGTGASLTMNVGWPTVAATNNAMNILVQAVTTISCLKLSSVNAHAISCGAGSIVSYNNINFGSVSGSHVYAGNGTAVVSGSSGYVISGPATSHINARYGSTVSAFSVTVLLQNTPNMASAYITEGPLGIVEIGSSTFTGTPGTGSQWNIVGCSVLSGTLTTTIPWSATGNVVGSGSQTI